MIIRRPLIAPEKLRQAFCSVRSERQLSERWGPIFYSAGSPVVAATTCVGSPDLLEERDRFLGGNAARFSGDIG
jgi:hypothetical protein